MTPQEQALVSDLFDRLSKLEGAPRDPEAEQLIRANLAKAPNALYALTQSVLVQDEALKQANARIRELEGEDPAQDQSHPKGFLDSMRDALFGGGARDDRRGSVPSVRPGDPAAMGVPPQYRTGASPWNGGQPQPQPQYAPAAQQDYGRGGGGHSFLGTAAAAAAGMIGGSLLLGGIRNALGGSNQGAFSGTFDQISNNPSNAASSSPFDNSAAGGDLSRQAGLNDIGGGGRQASYDDAGGRQGMFDTASNDDNSGDDGGDFDDGGGFDGGSDSE